LFIKKLINLLKKLWASILNTFNNNLIVIAKHPKIAITLENIISEKYISIKLCFGSKLFNENNIKVEINTSMQIFACIMILFLNIEHLTNLELMTNF